MRMRNPYDRDFFASRAGVTWLTCILASIVLAILALTWRTK